MKLREAYRDAVARLEGAGIAHASREVEELLGRGLGLARVRLWERMDLEVGPEEAGALRSLVSRRASREPLQLILGTWDFMGLPFQLGPGVLIPRPETESLASWCLEKLSRGPLTAGPGRGVLDLGTGSGCLLGSILKLGPPDLRGIGVDRSPAAALLASRNLRSLGLSARTGVIRGDWDEPLKPGLLFDLVVSNPPYVDPALKGRLEPELAWEPEGALFAGDKGLAAVAEVLAAGERRLRPGGWLALECGGALLDRVAGLLGAAWSASELIRDPGGHPQGWGLRRAPNLDSSPPRC